jgi:hypothetical protein
MAQLEEFFDLRIATIEPGEEPPADAHVVRIEEPSRKEIATRTGEGWFYKPCYVTYVHRVPPLIEEYIRSAFRAGTRNKPRKLLREVPKRYRLVVEENGGGIEAFAELYRRTIVAQPRGKDRLAEHGEGFGRGWCGLYLFDGAAMVAGVLVNELPGHLSVAYGAFDPAHRKLDLEHYLILWAMQRCIDRGCSVLSLGMDTNRYGHHLPLGLPAYKLRIGFTPMAYEPAGREIVRFQRFDVFERGLFFYSYEGRRLVGDLFVRGEPDLRPYRHHNAPEIRVHPIG